MTNDEYTRMHAALAAGAENLGNALVYAEACPGVAPAISEAAA